MPLPDHLQQFQDHPIRVLDDGHVQLIDVMGDDMTIVDAARVSYGKGTKRMSADRHLIRYLMRHRHTSPFEMCSITVRVRVPMDCWRQWIRHRTASVNEYSTRYSEAIDSAQAAEGNWRAQAKDNKQGSAGVVTEFPKGFRMMDIENTPAIMVPTTGSGYLSFREQQLQALSRVVYEERLAFGVAREQARKDLPLSTYTEAYWKMDLHNLFHFLRLRMDPHAQSEIREFANAIAEIVKEWVPWAWEAFEDYQLGGMYLTKFEQQGISALLTDLMDLANAGGPESVMPVAEKGSGLTKGRELRAFRDKLMRLLG